MVKGTRVIGYVRVSTEEQAGSGAGLEAQREALEHAAKVNSWTLVRIAEDAGASGKSMSGRPGLAAAIEAVERGEADGLAVAKLDRLSRSLIDFATLMERSRRRGWVVIALDLQIDTSTPSGEFMASVLASAAQWERRIIGQRTRDALAVKKAQGVRLGRPRTLSDATVARVVREREAGGTLAAIADRLTAEGVPTAHGGARWYASTIAAVLKSSRVGGALSASG